MAFSTNISSLRDCLNAAIAAITYQRGFYQYAYGTWPGRLRGPRSRQCSYYYLQRLRKSCILLTCFLPAVIPPLSFLKGISVVKRHSSPTLRTFGGYATRCFSLRRLASGMTAKGYLSEMLINGKVYSRINRVNLSGFRNPTGLSAGGHKKREPIGSLFQCM